MSISPDPIDQLLSKGILWTGDRREVSKVARAIVSEDDTARTALRVNRLLMALEIANDPATVEGERYVQAKQLAINELIESHPFELLKISWTSERYQRVLDIFRSRMPEGLLEEVLDRIRPVNDTNPFSFINLSDEDRDTLARLELEFFRRSSDIVMTPLYQDEITNLLEEVFVDYPFFQVIRANTIGDIVPNPKHSDWVQVSEPFARVLKRGVKYYLSSSTQVGSAYQEWWSVVRKLGVLEDRDLFENCLGLWKDPSDGKEETIPGIYLHSIEVLGGIKAAFHHSGVPDDLVDTIMRPIIKELLDKMVPHSEPIDLGFRKWLWRVYIDGAEGRRTVPETIAFSLHAIRNHWVYTWIPAGLINGVISLGTAIAEGIYGLLDKIFELVFGALETLLPHWYQDLIEYFYLSRAFISGLLPESRRRPKAVWALLFASSFSRLTPGERFALSCKSMDTVVIDPDYHDWAQHRLDQLSAAEPSFKMDVPIPIRRMRLPAIPTVADEELSALAPLMPSKMNTNKLASAWAKNLHAQGILPGIASEWFATPDRVSQSIRRYDVERPHPDSALRSLVLQTAHALADQFPDTYKHGKYLTPFEAFRKIKVKYSPGLPFIPVFKNRKELEKHGLLRAIAAVAERNLLDGIHPGTIAHAFAKSSVVKLQALLDGKNIRTVIAQDLVGNVLAYCSTIEPTRRQPEIGQFVMNAVPRSEGGFRPLYDVLREAPFVRQADAKEFDSKLAPVITYDGLVELRSIAFEESPAYPVILSQIKGTYKALTHCTMINLASGEAIRHTGGFMTGQANTSSDNKDSFRICIIAAWAAVTNRAPSEFYAQGNVIGNAGDDHVIKLTQDVWEPMLTFIRANFGIEIITEQTTFDGVDLVGLQPIPVPSDSIPHYSVNGIPVPDYAIASAPAAMLLKRTEWTSRVAGFQDVAFHMLHIPGLIGTAYLTCHKAEIYADLAEEYEKEASYILLRFFTKVKVTKEFSPEGTLLSLFLEVGLPRPRYEGKVSNVLKWLKGNRWPKYSDIFRIWVKPQVNSATKMRKDHAKLLSWMPQITHSEKALWGILTARELMYEWIPNHVARVLPEFTGQDVTYIMRNPDYMVAKFVWLSLYHSRGEKVPSVTLFNSALKESPYGSAEDSIGFLNWLALEKNFSELIQMDLEELRGRMFVATVIYWQIETLFKSTKDIPLLGILFNLYAFSTRDINRLYAFSNFIHNIATGRSSPTISNLMPADPYAWIKQLSVIGSNILPSRWQRIPGLRQLTSCLPWMVELWVGADSTLIPRPFNRLHKMLRTPMVWAELVGQLEEMLLGNECGDALIIAPTGTGKSTAFIATIFNSIGFPYTIWLLCPTITARDNYQNNFLPDGYFQILQKGVVNQPSRRLKILTYGHSIQRMAKEARAGDLILFDEMHLVQAEMLVVWHLFNQYKRLIVTATPRPTIMPRPAFELVYPHSRRFKVKQFRSPLTYGGLWTSLAATKPELLTRALIVCSSLAQVTEVRNTLNRISVATSALSSDEPRPSLTGPIVATTIVDTAITIEPPPTCLIDLGETLLVTIEYSGVMPKHMYQRVPTPPSVHTQRQGRVGRAGDSVAFALNKAGLGEELPLRLSPYMLLNEASVAPNVLSSFGLFLLVESVNQRTDFLRFLAFSTSVNMNSRSQNDTGLAVYIFCRLSDLMSVEAIHHEWLNLRLSVSDYDNINVLVDAINAANFGDPRLGSWGFALNLIEMGFIQVQVNGKLTPTSCLGVVGQSIVPCGYVGIYEDQIHPDARLLEHTPDVARVHWRTYFNFRTKNKSYDYVTSDPFGETAIPNSFVEDFTAIGRAPLGRHENLREYDNMVHRLYFRKTNHSKKVVIMVQEQQLTGLSDIEYRVFYRRPETRVPDPVIIDGLAIPEGISLLGLYLFLSVSARDDQLVFLGDVPAEINDLPYEAHVYGILRDQGGTWAVINPRFARAFADRYLDYVPTGEGDRYLSQLPSCVYFSSGISLSGYTGKNAMPVTLHASGYLARCQIVAD